MTAEDLARLHAAAFATDRNWTATEFADLLAQPLVSLVAQPHGFALTRTVAQEAELLTIAVDPLAQNRGVGRRLLLQWLAGLEGAADMAFLEVAADNAPALHLYRALGFEQTGARRGYYLRKDAPSADALILSRTITHGHAPVSAPNA